MDEQNLFIGLLIGGITQLTHQLMRRKLQKPRLIFAACLTGGLAGGLAVSTAATVGVDLDLFIIYSAAVPAGWLGGVYIESSTIVKKSDRE